MLGLTRHLAACFRDHRDPNLVEHSLETLLIQRISGIALGYEDLSNHDQLRHDPIMAVLAGKLTATRSDCAPVACKSTLNRLEFSRPEPTRYARIAADTTAIEALLVDLSLDAHDAPPEEIILDLDVTDHPLHGDQEGRFFLGYYDSYCYLQLYIFCDRHLLVARLRQANVDAAAGAREDVARLVARIRARWPKTRIILRADSGFCRDDLMTWAEANDLATSSAWRATNAWWRRLALNCNRHGPRPRQPPSRRVGSRTWRGGHAGAGAASVASSARRSGRMARPIPALS